MTTRTIRSLLLTVACGIGIAGWTPAASAEDVKATTEYTKFVNALECHKRATDTLIKAKNAAEAAMTRSQRSRRISGNGKRRVRQPGERGRWQ